MMTNASQLLLNQARINKLRSLKNIKMKNEEKALLTGDMIKLYDHVILKENMNQRNIIISLKNNEGNDIIKQ